MSFKYLEVATDIQIKINQGIFLEKLPTEQILMETYGCSRQTIRRALDYLVENRQIEKRQGSGSRVLLHDRAGGQVAVITSYINDYIFPSVLQDIHSILSRKNYSTLLYSTQNLVGNERTILQELLHKAVSGVIVEGSKTALPNPNLDLYEKMMLANIPIVFIHGCYRDLAAAVCVSDNDYSGGYMLARHLITKGHTKIAGIFKVDDIQGHQRAIGYCSAIRDAGLPVLDHRILWYSTEDRRYLTDYGHTEFLDRFYHFYLKECTAVVCYNDEIADKLIRLLLEKGCRIPEDIAIVSFDNSYLSDTCPVHITSLAHEPHKLGSVAANLLLEQISGHTVQSQQLPWRLVQKASG